jgi:hypothetical protein
MTSIMQLRISFIRWPIFSIHAADITFFALTKCKNKENLHSQSAKSSLKEFPLKNLFAKGRISMDTAFLIVPILPSHRKGKARGQRHLT